MSIPGYFGSAPSRRIVTAAPVRIDLSHGGGSDLPDISRAWGGAAVNMAVTIGERYARCVIASSRNRGLAVHLPDQRYVQTIDSVDELANYGRPSDPVRLHKAALFVAGLVADGDRRPLAKIFDDLGWPGLVVTTSTGLPVGSGLGTSSVLGAVVLQGYQLLAGRPVDPLTLVSQTVELERRMNVGGGWQDAVGGIKYSTVKPGEKNQLPNVTPIPLSPEKWRSLERRMVVCYTGASRPSASILDRLIEDFREEREPQLSQHRALAELDRPIVDALERGDWDRLGELIGRFWLIFKELVPEASVAAIRELERRLAPFVSGLKACGAGGGGCVMLIARDGMREHVLREIRTIAQSSKFGDLKALDARLAGTGLRAYESVDLTDPASDQLNRLIEDGFEGNGNWGTEALSRCAYDFKPERGFVSDGPIGQRLDRTSLEAGLRMSASLGKEYEGLYNGAGAAASVLHLHMQFHRGAGALWRNLETGAVSERLLRDGPARVSELQGWPAYAVLVAGADLRHVAETSARIVDRLQRAGLAYNLAFRTAVDPFLIVMPRSPSAGEKPCGLDTDETAWGRFGWLEMAGTIPIMNRDAHLRMLENPETPSRIREAIASMGLAEADWQRVFPT